MTAILLIFFLVCDVMVAGYLWSMPAPRHGQTFFGGTLSPGHPDARDKRTLFGYRLALVISFACIEVSAMAFMVRHWSILNVAQIRLVTYAALIAVGFADYIMCAWLVESPSASREPVRVASSLRTRRLSDYTNIAFEGIVIAATLLPFLFLALYYRSIPAALPTADSAEWLPRSFRLVFGASLVGLYLQCFVFILKYGMVRATAALPAEHADEHLKLKEESMRTYTRIWDMFRGLIAAGVIVNLRFLIRTPEQANLFLRIGFVFGLIIGAVGFVGFQRLMSRLSRLYRDVKISTGQVYVARPTDPAHWHAGGLIYYSRQDAALFVETPVGAKYTTSYALNLGNGWAYSILLYMAALPVVLGWSLGVL